MGHQPNTDSDPVEERLRNQIEEEKKQYVFILKKNAFLLYEYPPMLEKQFSEMYLCGISLYTIIILF